MNTVTIWKDETPWLQRSFENTHKATYVKGIQYKTITTGENAAEEAFHCSNAPKEVLNSAEQILASYFEGQRSLSVGDIVQVEDVFYRCASFGWKIVENPMP